MASKKGTKQALTWLQSKMNEGYDTLDGINAEICYNVITDLENENTKLGAIICKLKKKIANSSSTREKHASCEGGTDVCLTKLEQQSLC